jgi:putative spermidine/putrescine transport system permease protein
VYGGVRGHAAQGGEVDAMRRANVWSWVIVFIGLVYFFLPLVATFLFSLRAELGHLGFAAYRYVFSDPGFASNFGYSLRWAALTIIASLLLVVPTVYWVHLRVPHLRPVVEFLSLFPFVVPAVVLAFGLIKTYCCPPFALKVSPALLIAAYVVLSLPYMFRSVDAGLRAIDVRTLTEAAQSLGAGWIAVLFRVIFPNLRVAILSGVFLTFAIVIGEFTFASLFAWPAFGPYMVLMGQARAYEPAALSVVSFILTWASIGVIQWVGRGAPGGAQVAGVR